MLTKSVVISILAVCIATTAPRQSEAQPVLYDAVWRPSTGGETQVYGWTFSDFKAKYDALWNQGWRLDILQAYVADRKILYNAVWKPSTEREMQVYGWTFSDFKAKYDALWNQGWRLHILQAYVADGKVLYNAVWRPSTEGEKQVYGWTFSDFKAEYDALWNQGWRLHILQAYEADGKLLYNAVWRPSTESETQAYGWTFSDFKAKYDALWDQGYRLQILQAYEANGKVLYNAVWRPSTQAETQVYGWTFSDFKAKYDALWNQGWRLEHLQCYTVGKAMDIVSSASGVDDNGYFLNPTWNGAQGVDERPTPCDYCPCTAHTASDWTGKPNCTTQPVWYEIGGDCGDGHMNWFPITYEGTVSWKDYSFWDEDYNFGVKRDDAALYDSYYSDVQIEFSSDETVDRWDDADGTWWNHYHHDAVDGCWRPWDHCINDDQAGRWINGSRATVIGLAGLDCEHDSRCRVELHPVYAMFVQVDSNPDNDRWGFFVRNSGDEGWCSQSGRKIYLDPATNDKSIRVRLKYPGYHTPTIRSDIAFRFRGGDGLDPKSDSNPDGWEWYGWTEGDEVVLSFPFPEGPTDEYSYVGDIHIHWVPGSIVAPQAHVQPTDSPGGFGGDEETRSLTEKIEKLSPAEQAELASELLALGVRPAGRAAKPASCKIGKRPPSTTSLGVSAMRSTVKEGPGTGPVVARGARAELATQYLKAKGIQ